MRMRVVKRFLKKMAEPVVIMAYIAFAIYLSEVADRNAGAAAQAAVLIVMLILPMLANVLHFTWILAKREVEAEDNKFLNKLSGNGRF